MKGITCIDKLYFNVFYLIISFIFSEMLFCANFPFPQLRNYSYGIKPNNFNNEQIKQHLQQTFNAWKQNYLVKSGAPKGTYRIQRGSANNYDTVSEGIGYGMLILVLTDNEINNNRHYFDGLYRYYLSYLDQNSLMNWQIDKDGNVIGINAATDADEDVALALIFAHYQWGSENSSINYIEEAKRIIKRIMQYQVEKISYVLKPGDNFGGSDLTNPSYFAFSWFRIFEEITKDSNWQKVVDACYSVLEKAAHFQTGLIPDWCDVNGKEVSGYGYNYYYDACRVPWRVGLDYLWYGENRAYDINNKIMMWLSSSTYNDVNNIGAGYRLDGAKLYYYINAAFIGPFGVGSMIDEKYQNFCNDLYSKLASFPNGGAWGYYQDCLKMLTMLVMSGNFFDFTKAQVVNTIPTCQIIYPLEEEIISDDLNICVSASSNKLIKKVQLFFDETLIYESNFSSNSILFNYSWEISTNTTKTGKIIAVVYDIDDSSYCYVTNVTISGSQQKEEDGTGKVLLQPSKFFIDNTYDLELVYVAEKNISLGEIIVEIPQFLLDKIKELEIFSKYGSPVVANYNYNNGVIIIKILKMFTGERLSILFKNLEIPEVIGSHFLNIKTKTNGGKLKEIKVQPVFEIHSIHNKSGDKKVLTINKDYKNDIIAFDSKKVVIYNLNGKKVLTINNGVWDGRNNNSQYVNNGIYFYKEENGKKGIIYIIR